MLPRGWDRRTIVLLTFAFLFVSSAKLAKAQVFNLERDRVQMAQLHGYWRFHIGDDPDGKLGWAKPDFDDSSWRLLRSDQPLSAQGYSSVSGTGWYRFRIQLPVNHRLLGLYISGIGTSYQVFADGEAIGQFGGLPPHERAYLLAFTALHPPLGIVVPIPDRPANETGSLMIAIRVWIRPDWAFMINTQTFQALRVGDLNLLNEQRQQRWNYEFWLLSGQNALLLGYLLATLAGLGLFLLRPSESEYLWFAAVELIYASGNAITVYPEFHPVWYQGYEALDATALLVRSICVSMFFVTFLKERPGWPFWCSIISALFGAFMFLPAVLDWMSFTTWLPALYLAWVPHIVCQFLMLLLPARRGNFDARMLLVPFGLQWGTTLGQGLLDGISISGHGGPAIALLTEKWAQLFTSPFPISVQNVADLLAQLSLLAILILRFARTRRDEERFKSELEAARTVQQILIPEEIPAIPGLALECIYKPAGQVGGDFFQILPTPGNVALIVIGDVSGKGMPAAMAVSLLVGTVRTLAHYTQSPAEILAAMNQRMLARSKYGFTTCLVLRIGPEGVITLANAGHLAPYLNGQELPVDSGLPLGLAADCVYTESTFPLAPSQELTLLTDGVAEARARTGELFGFERTASISILSAEHIAATAQAFGQQDDITVLKIRRPVPEPALATAPVATLSLS